MAAFDGTGIEVTRGGSTIVTDNLDAGDTREWSCQQFDQVQADGPIYAMGNLNNRMHIGFQDRGMSGKNFLVTGTRSTPHRLSVFAFENTSVEFYRDGVLRHTQPMNAGDSYTYSDGSDGAFEVVSTALIAMHFSSNFRDDGQIVPPAAEKLIGFPSRTGYISPSGSGIVNMYRSDSTSYTQSATAGIFSLFQTLVLSIPVS